MEFRNHIAKRNSPVTTNADLKAIEMICRVAKLDGYIAEDPAEFVETVRKSSEQARRRSQLPKFRGLLPLRTLNGKA